MRAIGVHDLMYLMLALRLGTNHTLLLHAGTPGLQLTAVVRHAGSPCAATAATPACCYATLGPAHLARWWWMHAATAARRVPSAGVATTFGPVETPVAPSWIVGTPALGPATRAPVVPVKRQV